MASNPNATMHATANGFVLTYSDKSSGVDVAYAQVYDNTGAAVGGPQSIGQILTKEIDVAWLSNGKLALIWDSNTGVKLAEMNANGVLTGTVATVDAQPFAAFGWAMGSRVVTAGNGFLTLHMEAGGLVMSRFNNGFVQQGSAMTVLNAYPGTGSMDGCLKTNQNDPPFDIAVLRNGVIVVAWAGFDTGTTTTGNVLIRYFAPDGTALTDPISANSRTPDYHTGIKQVTAANGRVFLTFIDETNVPFGGPQASGRAVWLDGPDAYYVGTSWADTANGAAGDDAMRGNAGDDTLNGLGGDDQVSGWEGDDSLSSGNADDQVNGGDGNDSVSGDAGNDMLLGGSGNDTGSGGDGNDTISGQDGDDQLLGDANLDVIFGDAGNDTANGGVGADRIEGGDDNERLLGSMGNDSLLGQNGNDVLDGGEESDSLDGGAGNDRMLGQAGNDLHYGGSESDKGYDGAGDDIVNGGDGDDVLERGNGDDILAGQRGFDTLEGGAGHDVIYAGQNGDTLSGGDGNDILYAASGNDKVSGGLGVDLFDFSRTYSEGAVGQDVIIDFEVVIDKINLTACGLVFGSTLTLESRANGCALVTSMGDEIMIRGVTVAQFNTGYLIV